MVRSVQQLKALGDEWDALSARFRLPLLDHDWFVSCAEAFHRDEDLRILTIRDGSSLSGAAPLVHERASAGRRLMLLGVSRLYEPCGWLFSSERALSELVDRALALGQPMILQRIPAESVTRAALTALPRYRAVTVVRSTAASLAVAARGSLDVYYTSLSSRITSNLPRVRKKAEKALGPVTVEQLDPRPSEVDELLELVIAVEGSGWKGRRGSALGSRADLREFFRRYCHRAAEKSRLRVSRLSFGSHVAAVELSLEAYARMWQLKIGYHEQLAPFYPGLHLTESSIRSTFERGLDAYEFLGSAAAWQEEWRPEARRYETLAVYPVTAPGVIGACQDVAGALWRRVRRQRVGAVIGTGAPRDAT